eukprot:jgi/Chrzof1/4545/Cz14g17210.t1
MYDPDADNALAVELLDTSIKLLCELDSTCEGAKAAVRCLEVGVVPEWPNTIYINAISVMEAYALTAADRVERARNTGTLMDALDRQGVLINSVWKDSHTWAVKMKAMQAIIVLSQEHEFPSAGYAQWIVRKGGFEATTSLLQVNMGD